MKLRKTLSGLARRTGHLYNRARVVSHLSGKNIVHQAIELIRLRYGGVKLSGSEYYNYGLYDDSAFSPTAKREFISERRAERLHRHLNPAAWRTVATDKVLLYSILQGLGLSFPKLYAVYHHACRYFGAVPFIRESENLARFLRRGMPYPFFSKPVRGSHGIGAVAVMDIDRARDRLLLANGDEMAVGTYVDRLGPSSKGGHLFQEYLSSHPVMIETCGQPISSVRMMVLLSDDGPTLIRAIWKIPTGRNMTDNFNHGRSGNLLGQIDLTTGRVERVISGVGPEQVEVGCHPDTGKPVKGIFLPEWTNAVKLCFSAASALPGLRFQHWDVAFCRNGPVILEVNACGDLELAQLAYRAGLYDSQFRQYLATATSL